MTIDLQSSAIDTADPAALASLVSEVEGAGAFYLDAGGRGLYRIDGGAVRWIPADPPQSIGAFLVERGAVRLWNRRNPLPLQFQGVYRDWIGRQVLEMTLPRVEGAVRLPAMIRSGARLVVAVPGVGPDRRVYLGGATRAATVDPTYPHLRRLFSALEWRHPTYRANLYGLLCAMVARSTMSEFPLTVLDGTSRKVGKTAVAGALHHILQGAPMSPLTHTGDEESLEKRIAGRCGEPGPVCLVFDNVRPKRGQTGSIRSQFFAVATTCAVPSLRGPYKKKPLPLNYPILILTMNDASVETDLHDRIVRVVLGGEPGRFLDPHPTEYAESYRPEILAEIQAILSGIDLAAPFKCQTRMPLFERIAVQSAAALGLTACFDPDAIDTPDVAAKELLALVRDLQEESERAPTWAQLAEHLRVAGNLVELRSVLQRSQASTTRAQGRVLRAFVSDLLKRDIHVDGQPLGLVVSETTLTLKERS